MWRCFLLTRRRKIFFLHLTFFYFVWTWKYFYCHCIYNCVKSIHYSCWICKKNYYFLSFRFSIFHLKIHKHRGVFHRERTLRVRGVHVKRTGTNKGKKGVRNYKFQVNVPFECPQIVVYFRNECWFIESLFK